jgi:hypothetical protein
MSSPRNAFAASNGLRIVICDYNALLLSVTGFLRMSGYRVFQAMGCPPGNSAMSCRTSDC